MLFLCILVVSLLPLSGPSQWKAISRIGPSSGSGCLTYKQGVFWAGNNQLFRSTDQCLSWTSVGPTLDQPILGLDFFDKLNGVVGFTYGDLYVTHDGGLTWSFVYNAGSAITALRYGTSVNEILVGTEFPGYLRITHDGGLTWKLTLLEDWVQDFDVMQDGSLRAFVSSTDTYLGHLYKSTDDGTTWLPLAGTTGFDVWNYTSNRCDPDVLYLVNEQGAGAGNKSSIVWVSKDAGNSWTPTLTRATAELAGSLALGPHSIYCSTTGGGVFRSTDKGTTWKLFPGPASSIDSRQIVALTDNELFSIDRAGRVWHTTNSGGDSLHIPATAKVTTSVASLFDADTTTTCGEVKRAALLVSSGCGTRQIVSVQLRGKDSAYYALTHFPSGELIGLDSVVVVFRPDASRNYSSLLEIQLEDGTLLTVQLTGTGVKAIMQASTADVQTPTIGEGADIPVNLSYPLSKPTSDLVVEYDTSVLIYRGTSYSSNGTRVAESLASTPGHLHLHLLDKDLTLSDAAAMLHFEFYPMTSGCTQIWFDSLSVQPSLGCAAIEKVVSNLCTAYGCGTPSIGHFLRYRELPDLKLSPNPATGMTTITTSADLGVVSVEIVNALGELRYSSNGSITSNGSFEFSTSGWPSGVYFVRIRSTYLVKTLQLLHVE
jgi:photosystem II stability/assembly factor-like uncharacterized protein